MEKIEYYDLGEINIVCKGKKYRFINTGGTILDVDKDAAISILALQGHSFEEANFILKKIGFKISKNNVLDVLNFLKEQNLVNVEYEKPKSRRFDTERVLLNLKNGWEGPLIIIDVAITASSICPMDCKYCFRKYFSYKHNDKLKFQDIKKLLDDLRKIGCLTVNISGGEPASFPSLTEKIGSYAKRVGFENISVSTCGYGLNAEILKKWKRAGITYLNLSLDTMNKDIQDEISGRKGAWDEAISACKIACDIGLQVRINATCYEDAIKDIEKLAEFGKKTGTYKIRFNPLVPSAILPPVSPKIMRDVVKRVKALEKNGYSVYTPLEEDDVLPDILVCAAGITKAVVEVDGSVGGCQFMGNYPEPAGNILEKSFIEIWTKGNWSYFRDDLEDRPLPMPCAKCKDRIYCISYCLAYAHVLLGDAKAKGKITCPWKTNKCRSGGIGRRAGLKNQ